MRTAILATLAFLAACDTDDAATVCEGARLRLCEAFHCRPGYQSTVSECIAAMAADGMCTDDQATLDWTSCHARFNALTCPTTAEQISDAIIACKDDLDAQQE